MTQVLERRSSPLFKPLLLGRSRQYSRLPSPCGSEKPRFPLVRGLVWAVLAVGLILCHGCHDDEDNELCLPPMLREKQSLSIVRPPTDRVEDLGSGQADGTTASRRLMKEPLP